MTIASFRSGKYTENGSAFFVVLIALVVFAALTYALSRMDAGTNGLSSERQRVAASEIMDQGGKFADGVAKMRVQGVTATAISFNNTTVAGYNNAGCTTNDCLFFAQQGGGFEWQAPPPNVNLNLNWGFTGDFSIKYVGTTSADLVAILPGLSKEVCMKINELLGEVTNTTPTMLAPMVVNKFVGAYNGAPNLITSAFLDGKKAGCFMNISLSGTAVDGAPLSQTYVYYQVLLAN